MIMKININSKIVVPIILIMGTIILHSCASSSKHEEIAFGKFHNTIELTGEDLTLSANDSLVIGSVQCIDDGYLFYTLKSDSLLVASDTTFSRMQKMVKRGSGVNELKSISGIYGHKLNNTDLLSVYDPNTYVLYGINPLRDDSIRIYHEFKDSFRRYSPPNLIQREDGIIIAPRGDSEYGLIAYDPMSGTIKEWPRGLKHENPDISYEDELSLRYLSYNPENRMTGEIYGCNPKIILHDEGGNIVSVFRYDSYKPHKNSYGVTSECFRKVLLTKNYIWLLYGDPYDDENSHVFIIDYEGTPIADLIIEAAYDFTINSKNDKIIAVNPDSDDFQIKSYKLPDFIQI